MPSFATGLSALHLALWLVTMVTYPRRVMNGEDAMRGENTMINSCSDWNGEQHEEIQREGLLNMHNVCILDDITFVSTFFLVYKSSEMH